MKIARVETVISVGDFAASPDWKSIRKMALDACISVQWPPGSGSFAIYPESGKRRGEGNGVKPIKEAAMTYLASKNWQLEYPWPIGERVRPGNMDAAYECSNGLVAFEWETGNVSSSHRSINKICLGLQTGLIIAGILVVPSRELYKYLTDRIGNFAELEPYLPLWSSTQCEKGIFEIIVVEQNGISRDVPRIQKGTDGRARG